MATISKRDDRLVVTLSEVEKIETIRGGFEVPLVSVQQVERVEEPINEVHGLQPSHLKLYGVYIPGESAVGVFLNGGLKEKPAFIAIHRHDKHAVRITLTGTKYSELLIGNEDPDSVIKMLK